MMKAALYFFWSFILIASAFGFDEPDGLQMLKFGQDVRRALPKCDALTRDERAQNPCWRQHDVWVVDESKLAVDNIKVGEILLRIYIEQIDDKLEQIEARFSGARFDEMLDAMTARFGKPTKSTATTYQNAFGATSRYPVHLWIGKRVNIALLQVPLNRREALSVLTFKTETYLIREGKEKKEKGSGAAKDL
jgi:hypothetical protein